MRCNNKEIKRSDFPMCMYIVSKLWFNKTEGRGGGIVCTDWPRRVLLVQTNTELTPFLLQVLKVTRIRKYNAVICMCVQSLQEFEKGTQNASLCTPAVGYYHISINTDYHAWKPQKSELIWYFKDYSDLILYWKYAIL